MILLEALRGHSWENFGLGSGFKEECGLKSEILWMFSTYNCLTHNESHASDFITLYSLRGIKQASGSSFVKVRSFHLCFTLFVSLMAVITSIGAAQEGYFSNLFLIVLKNCCSPSSFDWPLSSTIGVIGQGRRCSSLTQHFFFTQTYASAWGLSWTRLRKFWAREWVQAIVWSEFWNTLNVNHI